MTFFALLLVVGLIVTIPLHLLDAPGWAIFLSCLLVLVLLVNAIMIGRLVEAITPDGDEVR